MASSTLAQAFNARVADLGADAIVFEIVGHPEEVDSFEELVCPHGLKELAPGGSGSAAHPLPRATTARSTSSLTVTKESPWPPFTAKAIFDLLSGKVAVVGYGSQGHAHALNLHDSGVEGRVGLRASSSRAAAEDAGVGVASVGDAVRDARGRLLLLPDQVQPRVYEEDVSPTSPLEQHRSSRTGSTSTSDESSRRPGTT